MQLCCEVWKSCGGQSQSRCSCNHYTVPDLALFRTFKFRGHIFWKVFFWLWTSVLYHWPSLRCSSRPSKDQSRTANPPVGLYVLSYYLLSFYLPKEVMFCSVCPFVVCLSVNRITQGTPSNKTTLCSTSIVRQYSAAGSPADFIVPGLFFCVRHSSSERVRYFTERVRNVSSD